jgi:hypothetical protein
MGQCQWTTGSNGIIYYTCGNIGVGTSAPNAKLELLTNNAGNAEQLRLNNPSDGATATQSIHFTFGSGTNDGAIITQGWSTNPFLALSAGSAEVMRLKAGNVGIGTTAPNAKLELLNNNAGNAEQIRLNNPSDGATATQTIHFTFGSGTNDGATITQGWSTSPFLAFSTGGSGEVMRLKAGNVGIGTAAPTATLHVNGTANVSGNTTVGGSLTVTGNIAAKYQDVAEWVPASQSIPVATVVTLDPARSNLVMPSGQSYDTAVAGVVSTSPGLTLGEGGAGKVLVATTGRVKVKVDATAAPIRVGDLLVTSDKPGLAMKSQPVDIGGVKIHRPGTLIGKALEPLEKGQGEILVLLSLQ